MFGGIIHGPKMEVTVKIQEPALIGSSSSLFSSAVDAVGRFLSTKFLPNHWVEIQSTLLAGRAVESASVAPEIFTPTWGKPRMVVSGRVIHMIFPPLQHLGRQIPEEGPQGLERRDVHSLAEDIC